MTLWDTYINFRTSEKDDFVRVANRLLSVTFLTRKNEENKKDYYFAERHFDLFYEYFRMAGWTLLQDRSLGVLQLINDHGLNREKLRLEESIVVLIVRLCYEEKRRKELTLTDNVCITPREIQERYLGLKIREKPLDRKTLREVLGMLKRYNILRNLDSDLADPECRLEVFPSILLAVKVEDIKHLYDKLSSFAQGQEPEDSGEESA
jgi:hypothetical protein